MIFAVDHLVVAVRDLERAAREFRAAGLRVTPQPRRGSTVTARVPCAGAYLELRSYDASTSGTAVRLLAKAPGLGALVGTQTLLDRQVAHGAGLVRLALRTDDLDATVRSLRVRGVTVTVSDTDGRHVATPFDATLPVLIAARASESAGPVIERVTIISDDPDRTAYGLTALLGPPVDARWTIGSTTVGIDAGDVGDRLPALRARLRGPLPATAATLGLSDDRDHPGSAALDRLSAALRLRTVSHEDPADNIDDDFVAFGDLLERSFPRVHETLSLTRFGHSRLYTWPGTTSEPAALFLAHMDVVPVDDPDRWTHPPFAGVVDDEFVWGRGAIDDKSRVLAWLETIEQALADGITPTGTLYFAFGHDEEVGGAEGAARIAEHLRAEGIRPALLLDEGGIVSRGVVDGVDRPVASVMLGEKGFATVRLTTTDPGGHSSMPPRHTAVGRIAAAVDRLQENPMPVRLTPVILDMVKRLAPFMSEPRRSILSAADRLGAVIAKILTAAPHTEALVRTTTAPTVIHGGIKANVLPQHAEALVNFRILPGDSVSDVLVHCRDVIADESVVVDLTTEMVSEPSPLTAVDDPGFALLSAVVRELIPDVAITTGIVPGATDARHYNDVFGARFNFAPTIFDQADLGRIHGSDERISHANYARLLRFNRRLVEEL